MTDPNEAVDDGVPGDVSARDGALDDAAGRLAVTFCRLNRMLRRRAPTGLGAGSLSALATVVRSGPPESER